jgi:hypothetical protein
MRNLAYAPNLIILDKVPMYGSAEFKYIAWYADRHNGAPAVIKYRSSYVLLEYIYDWTKRNGLEILMTCVQIPDHPWTMEEPWGNKITIKEIKQTQINYNPLMYNLRTAIELIDLAEEQNYQRMDEVLAIMNNPRRGMKEGV